MIFYNFFYHRLTDLKYVRLFIVIMSKILKIILFILLLNTYACSGGGSGGSNITSLKSINSDNVNNENISSELDTSLNEIFSLFNELGL